MKTIEVLGRVLGAEFLLKGVAEMPDPGARWNPGHRNPAMTLPADYMKDFAVSLRSTLIKKFHDEEIVDEAIQRILVRVTTSDFIQPMTRKAAEWFVRDRLVKQTLDVVRERQRQMAHEHDLLGNAADDVEDPRALQDMQRELGPRVWARLMDYLAKNLHEDVPLFIALSIQGYDNDEIVRKLPHYTVPASGCNSYLSHFVYPNGNKGGIAGVSKKFFSALHTEAKSSHDEAFV
jgi:hypothetical protein